MVKRIALLAACLAASATLAIALALAGFGPSHGTPVDAAAVDAAAIGPAATASGTPAPTAAEQVQVDTIYVKPTASPKVIKVVRTAPPKPPVVVHKVVVSRGGDDENEGSDD